MIEIKNYLEYKGFRGSVEYSQEDNILHGKIIGIRDLVSYEGKSLDELKKDFRGAVDDYLYLCRKYGKSLEPPVYV